MTAAENWWDSLVDDDEPVHLWFGLSYANYLTLPRSLLQSMPDEWQKRFVTCLYELDAHFEGVPQASRYRVTAIDEDGRFTKDPVPHYDRGRTRIVAARRADAAEVESEPATATSAGGLDG